MLNNDTPTSVKLPGSLIEKLRLLKALYKLKNIAQVVEHLLDENGFEGKDISISIKLDAADLRSVMKVDSYRLTEHRADGAALRSVMSPPPK